MMQPHFRVDTDPTLPSYVAEQRFAMNRFFAELF